MKYFFFRNFAKITLENDCSNKLEDYNKKIIEATLAALLKIDPFTDNLLFSKGLLLYIFSSEGLSVSHCQKYRNFT